MCFFSFSLKLPFFVFALLSKEKSTMKENVQTAHQYSIAWRQYLKKKRLESGYRIKKIHNREPSLNGKYSNVYIETNYKNALHINRMLQSDEFEKYLMILINRRDQKLKSKWFYSEKLFVVSGSIVCKVYF